MSNIYGDWFHSRSSSNLSELIVVRNLVFESQKPYFIGLSWSGGRVSNEKMYQFSHAVGIEPSTMQTKIRAMIRYGFIVDETVCPLQFTRIGELWNDLYYEGNYSGAQTVYELILTISLATFAFNNSKDGYSLNPSNGELPLKFIFNILINNAISIKELEALIDGDTKRVGKNISYWKKDLLNSGLFQERNGYLFYSGKFQSLIEAIKNFEPNSLLSNADWQAIRENPLIEISPFKDEVKEILLDLAEAKELIQIIDIERITEPLIKIVCEVEEKSNVQKNDILSEGTTFVKAIRRVRNARWAYRIKQEFAYKCVTPICDVLGQEFVQAAHIKPDAVEEVGIPHRTHILNGLCLCNHCHIAFDRGYISLDDNFNLLVSSSFEIRVKEQHIKRVIMSSQGSKIKPRIDNRNPVLEFVQYHRKFRFIA